MHNSNYISVVIQIVSAADINISYQIIVQNRNIKDPQNPKTSLNTQHTTHSHFNFSLSFYTNSVL